MQWNRREFARMAGAMAASPFLQRIAPAAAVKADYALNIEETTLDVGRGISIRTASYGGQVPGPLLRMKEGVPVTIDVTNKLAVSEIVHWHGLAIDSLNDGAAEEGSPMIAPGSMLRYHFTPRPSGTRWYHTHAMAMDDLSRSTYSGQFGFLIVDGVSDPGNYDLEVHLAIHHWGAHFVPMVETMRMESQNRPQTTGSDVGYRYATINAHMLGAGEPIRVKQGQRVLMRLLNASATENVILSLPGHTFRILRMDGNPVPHEIETEIIALGVAERIDAVVEMNSPGVWVLGSTLAKAREMGLGIVVEYAGRKGEPIWKEPENSTWDYVRFCNLGAASDPDESFTLTFRDAGALNGSRFDTWTINGDSRPKIKPLEVRAGKRYRLIFRNASADQHPMHLHRHTFEVAKIGDTAVSGLHKDVTNVMPLQTVAVDFVANNPGDTLMHCHQQLHMDYGFMQLIRYVG